MIKELFSQRVSDRAVRWKQNPQQAHDELCVIYDYMIDYAGGSFGGLQPVEWFSISFGDGLGGLRSDAYNDRGWHGTMLKSIGKSLMFIDLHPVSVWQQLSTVFTSLGTMLIDNDFESTEAAELLMRMQGGCATLSEWCRFAHADSQESSAATKTPRPILTDEWSDPAPPMPPAELPKHTGKLPKAFLCHVLDDVSDKSLQGQIERYGIRIHPDDKLPNRKQKLRLEIESLSNTRLYNDAERTSLLLKWRQDTKGEGTKKKKTD